MSESSEEDRRFEKQRAAVLAIQCPDCGAPPGVECGFPKTDGRLCVCGQNCLCGDYYHSVRVFRTLRTTWAI
jgi:hypothetical protein